MPTQLGYNRARKIVKQASNTITSLPLLKVDMFEDSRGFWEREAQRLLNLTETPAYTQKIRDLGLNEAKVDEQIADTLCIQGLEAAIKPSKKRGRK